MHTLPILVQPLHHYPFHQVILLFLGCINDFLMGMRVAVLWFFFLSKRCPSGVWLASFLSSWQPCMLLVVTVSRLL
jgi:hypothetical protein